LKDWKTSRLLIAVCLAVAAIAVACSNKSPSVVAPSAGSLTAPTISAPTDDQQLDTLQPTLSVSNSSSGGAGVRTYDFQVAESAAFSPVVASKLSVAENSGGKTSVTIDTNLSPSSRYYWRARMVQGGVASDWAIGKFRTKLGSYNRSGELWDILSDGFSIGERVGSTTFVPGKGLRIDNAASYVRYQLPSTVSAGEFSMEVEGLAPNGPGAKQSVFSMMQGASGAITGSSYEMFAQYRGSNGNPDNCVTFKAVWGSTAYKLEPDFAGRSAGIMSLNPGTTYFWQGTWTATTFRLVVKSGGVSGSTIYDRTITADGGSYAPNPHVAFIGSNAGAYGTDAGSFAGMIVRNVWLSTKPRP
jgi:hypothetical protein